MTIQLDTGTALLFAIPVVFHAGAMVYRANETHKAQRGLSRKMDWFARVLMVVVGHLGLEVPAFPEEDEK